MTILSQINTVETKGKKVASTTIATTSKSTVVNTNVYPQVKWGAVRRGKGNRTEKLEGFTTNVYKHFPIRQVSS